MAFDIVYRDGRIDDARAVTELDGLCFEEGIAFEKNTFYHYLRDPASVKIVAETENKIVGFVLAKVYRNLEAYIITLDVHPEYRRLGIGQSLIDRALEFLIKLDAAVAILQVAVNNDAAIRVYEKAGFKKVSIIEDYYQEGTSSRFTDAYLMVKDLN